MKKNYLDPEFKFVPLSSACAFLSGSTDGTTPSTPEDWEEGDGNDFDEWN